jgi:hypothetical protein
MMVCVYVCVVVCSQYVLSGGAAFVDFVWIEYVHNCQLASTSTRDDSLATVAPGALRVEIIVQSFYKMCRLQCR